MEVAGLDRETADLERARRFVRLAGSAIRDAATSLGSGSPESIVRSALVNATARHLPAAASAVAAALPTGGGPRTSPVAEVPMHGGLTTALVLGSPGTGQSGTWRRHGNHIVLEVV
jgi:hypothetical protein